MARSGARRFSFAALATAMVVALALPGGAVAQDPPADTEYEPGQAAEPGEPTPFVASTAHLPDLDAIDPIRFEYDEAIVEFAQVATRTGTPVGTGTGLSVSDVRIWVDIIRPDTDEPVPTILISSPYYNTLGRGWRAQGKTPTDATAENASVHVLGGPTEDVLFPEWYDEYFVPRGYAVALMDLRGTRNSSGCQVYGDRDEVLDTVDVIDWIAEQDWSNGKVGMTGGSYDGTIANGAASEIVISGRNPDALGAIIPIRSIGRWYDYHFINGTQSSSHQLTPALFTAVLAAEDSSTAGANDLLYPWTLAERKACIPTVGAAVAAGYASPYQDTSLPFWTERDFIANAADYNTAVFVISGIWDYNVRNNNTVHLWEAMTGDNPRKLWLGNMDHADPDIPTIDDMGTHVMPFPYRAKFVDATHRWYLQFLKGVEAGALDMPTVEVQDWLGQWSSDEMWPVPGQDLVLYPQADGTVVPEGGEIADGTVSWEDGPNSNAPSSVAFVSDVFEVDTRMSGQVVFELDLTASGPDTTVAVRVALLPSDMDDPAVASAAPLWDFDLEPAVVGTYGYARAWYRDSLTPRGISSPTGGAPVTPGSAFELDFGSLGTDLVIPAGYKLGFQFSSSDGGVVASDLGDTVTMALGAEASRILIPIAGEAPEPEPAPAPAPAPEPAPETAPATEELPATGGGLVVLAMTAAAASARLGRRRA